MVNSGHRAIDRPSVVSWYLPRTRRPETVGGPHHAILMNFAIDRSAVEEVLRVVVLKQRGILRNRPDRGFATKPTPRHQREPEHLAKRPGPQSETLMARQSSLRLNVGAEIDGTRRSSQLDSGYPRASKTLRARSYP
jgi:hypothetical protein